jgi:predicted O-methyltransferase YrrM
MIYKKIKQKIKNIWVDKETMKIQEDIYALSQLQPLSSNYIVWSSSSIRPSAMVQILNEIIVNHRNTIVEFGCGITTVYIAKILKQNGGHLYSVEDNSKWIEIVSTMLKQDNLQDYVTFIHAPLSKSTYSLENCDWYDENIVQETLKGIELDMVIVDGPPAYMEHTALSRYPAIPALSDQLSDDFCIVLDDIYRDGEKEILTNWEKELHINFNRQYVRGGIAIAHSIQGFNI